MANVNRSRHKASNFLLSICSYWLSTWIAAANQECSRPGIVRGGMDQDMVLLFLLNECSGLESALWEADAESNIREWGVGWYPENQEGKEQGEVANRGCWHWGISSPGWAQLYFSIRSEAHAVLSPMRWGIQLKYPPNTSIFGWGLLPGSMDSLELLSC